MAMLSANAPRVFNIAVRRESIALTAFVVVAIVALAYGHRAASDAISPAEQGWTGHLTTAAPVDAAVPVQPMSSSSLVVPKSALTLPAAALKPVVHAKNSCDSADRLCVVRPVAVMAPPLRRQTATVETPGALLPPGLIPVPEKASLVTKQAKPDAKGFSLNPLNHIPDVSAIGHPFAAAGEAVGKWIRWP